jgi:phosphocarrier protein
MVSEALTIRNSSGFHARPAGIFVETASRFRSEIRVRNGTQGANGKSILGLMLLGAAAGTGIVIEAEGDDEAEALAALSALIRGGFGETPDGATS